MRNWLFIGLAVVSITLYQNCSATHQNIEGVSLDSSSGTTVDDVDMAKSFVAFQNSLYPITQEDGSCKTCHNVDQQPLHSNEDAFVAHDVMISFGLVDLRNPPNSRVMEMLNNGHQGFDAAFIQRVEDAIQDWSDELVANGGLIGVGEGVQPVYLSLFTNVFEPKCVSCHQEGQAGEDYDYTNYVNTINTGGVSPGDAGGSLIMSYTDVDHEDTDTAPVLTAEERAALSQWINLGALNN